MLQVFELITLNFLKSCFFLLFIFESIGEEKIWREKIYQNCSVDCERLRENSFNYAPNTGLLNSPLGGFNSTSIRQRFLMYHSTMSRSWIRKSFDGKWKAFKKLEFDFRLLHSEPKINLADYVRNSNRSQLKSIFIAQSNPPMIELQQNSINYLEI